HMAAACAEYLQADQLIYLTDVEGVLADGQVISHVHCDEIGSMVQNKTVSGGMVLKLEAAKRALEGGVRAVHIVGGTLPDSLLIAPTNPEARHSGEAPIRGTRVSRQPVSISTAKALSAA